MERAGREGVLREWVTQEVEAEALWKGGPRMDVGIQVGSKSKNLGATKGP